MLLKLAHNYSMERFFFPQVFLSNIYSLKYFFNGTISNQNRNYFPLPTIFINGA